MACRILGISAFYHDSAATLLCDGSVVAALQEERFSRKKNDPSFPARAVAAALRIGDCRPGQLDFVVFYEKPFLKFERLLETYLKHCPRGLLSYLKAMPPWLREKMWIKDVIRRHLEGYSGDILFADHHESHAASAFYPSPFPSAAVLTVEAVGEWTTMAMGRGEHHRLDLDSELRFPHSLGLLYSAFTYYLGFKVNSGEYKLMGLAPYGRPTYTDQIRDQVVEIGEDGSLRLNLEFFDFEVGLKMTSRRFEAYFGGPPRGGAQPLTQRHKDLAASIQKVTEEALLAMCRHLKRRTAEKNLCMAGGLALNCVANGRVLRESDFENLWVQPASGDAGGSLGAAMALWHRFLQKPRPLPVGCQGRDSQRGSLLGTAYGREEIRRYLESRHAVCEELAEGALLERTAAALAQGSMVAWFQGHMEFGPRALGSRSLLADPRTKETRDRLNARVKFRESFRPFAPAVPVEEVGNYFDLDRPSPYMSIVAQVRPESLSRIPAVTHVDGSARVQTVSQEENPRFHRLLMEFGRITGCPVLLNTSFNVRGEPVVESPHHAFECFMCTQIDYMALGDFWLTKEGQPSGLYD